MHLAAAAGFGEFFVGKKALLFRELAGEGAVADNLGVECRNGHSHKAHDDQGDQHAVGLVPHLGISATL
jgi:hypothetical protein